jgi:hypothetical protein
MSKELKMKKCLLGLCTVALLSFASPAALALETPMQTPVVIADSESFELVGRLEAEGFVIFVDRAASNAPVLNAVLEVEQAGQKAIARFRPESGDYLIADANWLKALRQPGDFPLAFTLQAGDEADLLAADLVVVGPLAEAGLLPRWGLGRFASFGLLLVFLAGMAFFIRRRKAGKGGAA